MALNIINFSFYSISVLEDTPMERSIAGAAAKDVKEYVEHIINEVTTPPKGQQQIRGQYYHFRNDSERVAKNLLEMADDLDISE